MAWHLLRYGPKDKKTLLVDSDLSPSNTRTWCYWSKDEIPFNDLIYKSWNRMAVGAKGSLLEGVLQDFPYHCIRESDYKEHILEALKKSNSIELLESRIKKIEPSNEPVVTTDDGLFKSDYIFQSCYQNPDSYTSSKFKLKQHFFGLEIETDKDCFDPGIITLMDFNIPQKNGVTFFYTLPFDKRHAIVEFTLFSESLIEKQEYEEALSNYLQDKFGLKTDNYKTIRTENGIIPMVERAYKPYYGEKVLNLGIPGGVTKPSTGYTFTRIQHQCRQIAESLAKKGKPQVKKPSSYRYRVYDILLLQIIQNHPNDAIDVFYHLFRGNDFDSLLHFLDEKTNFIQEFGIFTTVPYHPFLRAIYKTKGLIISGA